MEFNIRNKKFEVDLVDRGPLYLDQAYFEKNLTEIYDKLNPDSRDSDYAPYPYFHPSKTDKTNNKFTSMNGILKQIKEIWDEVVFEHGLNNVITIIFINNDDKQYHRRVLSVSEKERRKEYESR